MPILLCLDHREFVALVMLDLLAAFDTVHHATLLSWLELPTVFTVWHSAG